MERTTRLRCIGREYQPEATRLAVPGIRCLLAEQQDPRSRHRRLLMFAEYSCHQRRWRYSALRQFPDAPAKLIRFHVLVAAGSIAIPAGYTRGSRAAVG